MNPNTETLKAQIVGKGKGMRIVPFPDLKVNEVLSIEKVGKNQVVVEYRAKSKAE